MVELLIVILCTLSLFQGTQARFIIASAFSWSCAFHLLFLTNLNGVLYYLSAGLFDLAIVFLICVFAKPTDFTDRVYLISAGSLVANFYGWIIYEMCMPPTSYNIIFHVLYFAAICTFLARDKVDGVSNLEGRGGLRLPYRKRGYAHSPVLKKA